MKKFISITIITLIFTAVSFAQEVEKKSIKSENDLVTLLKEQSKASLQNSSNVNTEDVSAEKKYNLPKTRMMRSAVNMNLYNEKFRRYNGYKYNNRPLNHNYIR